MADGIKQDSAHTFPTPIKTVSVSNSSMSSEAVAALYCATLAVATP